MRISSDILVRWIIKDIFPYLVLDWTDLGSGNGDFLRQIGLNPIQGIAVDLSEGNLPDSFLLLKEDIREFLKRQYTQGISLLTIFDVVEHFEKPEALGIIEECKRVGRHIILSTPRGFLKDGGEGLLEHKCGFEKEELESWGFKVFVIEDAHHNINGKCHDKLVAVYSPIKKWSARRKYIIYLLNPIHFLRMLKRLHRREIPQLLPKKEFCRKHYFQGESFERCPECGWRGEFTPK